MSTFDIDLFLRIFLSGSVNRYSINRDKNDIGFKKRSLDSARVTDGANLCQIIAPHTPEARREGRIKNVSIVYSEVFN